MKKEQEERVDAKVRRLPGFTAPGRAGRYGLFRDSDTSQKVWVGKRTLASNCGPWVPDFPSAKPFYTVAG